jgi:dipeptidyl aminopeptidase/acylaminoacyl peptidase
MGINMTSIFISYDRDDRPFIRQLARQLRRVYGYEGVWYDENIRGGEDWWNEIRKEIAKSDIFMYLLSAESAKSPYCQQELSEAKRLNKEVLPVRIEALQEIPENLKQIQYVDMSEGEITVENFTELNAAIAQISDRMTRAERHRLEAAARKGGWMRWGLVAVPISIVALLVSALVVSTPSPPFQGQIAFTTGRSSNSSLAVFDGGVSGFIGTVLNRNPRALTEQTSIESPPSWSPDGSRIAFAQRGEAGIDLYVMNADGSSVQRLTDDGQNNHYPTWSPDGRQIAFSRDAGGGNLDIFTIEVNFSDPANVAVSDMVNITNDPASDDYPAWSPDGTQIAFSSTRGENGRWNIYLLDLNSGEVQALTINNGDNTSPAWSPDRFRLSFESNRQRLGPGSIIGSGGLNASAEQAASNWDIYVMDTDGSGVVPITKSPGTDRYPRWSPDGAQLIFTSDRDGDFDLYLVDVANRQNVVMVTDNIDNDVFSTWK